jgi:hypothetical protein
MAFTADDGATLLLFTLTVESSKSAKVWLSEALFSLRSKVGGQVKRAVAIDVGDGTGWSIPPQGYMTGVTRSFEKANSRVTVRLCFAVPKKPEWTTGNVDLCIAVPLTTVNGAQDASKSQGNSSTSKSPANKET